MLSSDRIAPKAKHKAPGRLPVAVATRPHSSSHWPVLHQRALTLTSPGRWRMRLQRYPPRHIAAGGHRPRALPTVTSLLSGEVRPQSEAAAPAGPAAYNSGREAPARLVSAARPRGCEPSPCHHRRGGDFSPRPAEELVRPSVCADSVPSGHVPNHSQQRHASEGNSQSLQRPTQGTLCPAVLCLFDTHEM